MKVIVVPSPVGRQQLDRRVPDPRTGDVDFGRASYHGGRSSLVDRWNGPDEDATVTDMCAHLIRVASTASPQRAFEFVAALRLTATSHRIEGIDFGRQ